MAWFFLFLAGLFEIIWAIALKYSQSFSKLWPSVLTVGAMAISIYFLSLALKELPLGIAYSIWTGIGVIGTVIFGIILFDESKDILKVLFVLMIVAGIVGLRLITPTNT